MKIQECMSSDVWTIREDTTLRSAAELMAKHDLGSLPVARDAKLVGMLTDRDIAVRGIGLGKGPETRASEAMSSEMLYCLSHDDVEDVLQNMGEQQVRRLVVVDENSELVGIVSISDLAPLDTDEGSKSFAKIAKPSDQHSQSLV
ncbi:MAG: CBS domain-containing protein [Sphingomonadaceae bacterium]